MTDYKALCTEILKLLDNYEDGLRVDWDDWRDRARAALAQPEPVASCTEDEAIVAYDSAYRKSAGMEHTGFGAASSYTEHHREGIRAVLARCGRPAITPIPVSERLPGADDCDAEGRCYIWDWLSCDWKAIEALDKPLDGWSPTWWLPFDALPIPPSDHHLCGD